MTESAQNKNDKDGWRLEFDDFSDADYIMPEWVENEDTNEDLGIESNDNSLIVEDIETSSDENVFVEKNLR